MSQIICLDNKIRNNDKLVTPKEFLHWAKQDLLGSDKRACGNALGNIKKSIHCRIDEIIYKTNITYGKNWNSHINTPQKLEILKEVEIKYIAVVQLITDERNKFEHDYTMPDIDQIKAFYDTTELWLEKTYLSYDFDRIGIILKSDKLIINNEYNILDNCNFEYYWLSKKEIHDFKNGKLEIHKFSDIDWMDLLKYQKRYFKNLIENKPLYTLDQKTLTMIYKRLKKFNNIS
jgi:hypothetical protein